MSTKSLKSCNTLDSKGRINRRKIKYTNQRFSHHKKSEVEEKLDWIMMSKCKQLRVKMGLFLFCIMLARVYLGNMVVKD